jgi:hypothetical protein
MIDPTRDEWEAARERLAEYDGADAGFLLTEAALGCPCPPEPEPPRWLLGELEVEHCTALEVEHCPDSDRGVWVGLAGIHGIHRKLTPDEADAMADALRKHARYAREQGAEPTRNAPVAGPLIPAPICGRGWPLCQRPNGHAGPCKAAS